MNGMRLLCLALLGWVSATFPLPASAQDVPALVDATMEAMRGGSHTLSAERGHRAVVLFYDDRDHIEDNAGFKGDLERFIIDNHLDDRVVTYGVANLADVGMVPHALVRSMISPLLDRFRTDILLDWDGVMRRPPFSFPTAQTTSRDHRSIWRDPLSLLGRHRRRAAAHVLSGCCARRSLECPAKSPVANRDDSRREDHPVLPRQPE